MPEAQLGPILRHVCSLAEAHALSDKADSELLGRFAAGDEAAFATLVRRHGPMVLRVCRRGLSGTQDAEDVFQATFLLLARKAGSIRKRESVGSWLHGVAHRLAGKLRRQEAGRKAREQRAAGLRPTQASAPAAWRELEAVLDDALQELPAMYRTVLVLCYLEGLTQEEAAARVGCPLGTVRSRLARARELLRDRLARRGVALSAAALATALAADVPAALPEALAETVLRAVADPEVVTVQSAALAAGGLKSLSAGVLKTITAVVFVVIATAAGAGLLVPRDPEPRPAVVGKEGPRDRPADPLPDGALVRMGSTRWRHSGLSHFVFPPGGKTVLTAGEDHVLRYWGLAEGRPLRAVPLQGRHAPGQWVGLAPDGRTAASNRGDVLVVWETASGKEVKTLPAPKGQQDSLFFSDDGKTLAVLTWDFKATLWDWDRGKATTLALPARKIGQDSTYHACFSPDGKWFAAGGGAGEVVCVHELPAGREAHRLRCDATTSAFSPDGKTLAVATMTNDKGESETVVRLFDLGTGKESAQLPQGVGRSFFSLRFSPDGKQLACGFSDHSRVLELATGRVLLRLPEKPWAVDFAPGGKEVVAAYGRRLRVWDVATGTERHQEPGEFGFNPVLAVSPDGKLLAAGDWMEQAVSVWDAATGRLVRWLPLGGERRYVRNLAFSPDGKTLTACQYKGFVQSWDVATGRQRGAVRLEDPAYPNKDLLAFYELYLSPDGRHVTTLEQFYWEGATARLGRWDAATGKPLHLRPLSPTLRKSAWSADGRAVALPMGDTGLSLLGLTAAGFPERLRIPNVPAGGPLAFSGDGRLLAAGITGKNGVEVRVWETATGQEVAAVDVGREDYPRFAGGRYLVTAATGGLRLWDLAEGKERRRWAFLESAPGVFGLTLSPDGGRAFTAMSDGTALVWDVGAAMRSARPAKAPGEDPLAAWWADLAADNARRAYAAVWRLAESPQAAGFLRGRLKPVTEVGFETVQRLIVALDAEKFAVREKAFKELEAMGDGALPALRQALKKGPSVEVRRRLEMLLRPPEGAPSEEEMRRRRAVWVLEVTPGDDARRLLAELAAGMPEATQTQEAKAALARRADVVK